MLGALVLAVPGVAQVIATCEVATVVGGNTVVLVDLGLVVATTEVVAGELAIGAAVVVVVVAAAREGASTDPTVPEALRCAGERPPSNAKYAATAIAMADPIAARLFQCHPNICFFRTDGSRLPSAACAGR